ncbi:MAG: hypothetical protein RIS17_1129 [Pseudomonadota bacterium]|jgi:anti-anti-sigma regulatory factor
MCSAPNLPDDLPDAVGCDEVIIALPPVCSTAKAEDVMARLVIASDQERDIAIDAAAVDSIGQAVFQLLVAARIDARRVGQRFHIRQPSPAFMERASACQLIAALGLEADTTEEPDT